MFRQNTSSHASMWDVSHAGYTACEIYVGPKAPHNRKGRKALDIQMKNLVRRMKACGVRRVIGNFDHAALRLADLCETRGEYVAGPFPPRKPRVACRRRPS